MVRKSRKDRSRLLTLPWLIHDSGIYSFFFYLKFWFKCFKCLSTIKRNQTWFFSSFHLNCIYARQEKRRKGKIFSANLSYFISHFLVIRGIDKILIKMNFHAVYQSAPPMVCKSFTTKNRNSHLIDERTWSLHFSEYRAGLGVLHPTANS